MTCYLAHAAHHYRFTPLSPFAGSSSAPAWWIPIPRGPDRSGHGWGVPVVSAPYWFQCVLGRADLQNMCLDAHFHESTGRGGRWTASPGVDSRCGRVDSFGRARSARRKFSTRMRSCRTCVQTLMIMSGQLGPGRVDSGRCHEWTVRQLLQVGLGGPRATQKHPLVLKRAGLKS